MEDKQEEELDQEVEVFQYLEELRESGITNFFGAIKHLQRDFEFDPDIAWKYLLRWMQKTSGY